MSTPLGFLMSLWLCMIIKIAAADDWNNQDNSYDIKKQIRMGFRDDAKITSSMDILELVDLDVCHQIPEPDMMGNDQSLLWVGVGNPPGYENIKCRISTTDNCDWAAKAPAQVSVAFEDHFIIGRVDGVEKPTNTIFKSYKCINEEVDGWQAKLGV